MGIKNIPSCRVDGPRLAGILLSSGREKDTTMQCDKSEKPADFFSAVGRLFVCKQVCQKKKRTLTCCPVICQTSLVLKLGVVLGFRNSTMNRQYIWPTAGPSFVETKRKGRKQRKSKK